MTYIDVDALNRIAATYWATQEALLERNSVSSIPWMYGRVDSSRAAAGDQPRALDEFNLEVPLEDNSPELIEWLNSSFGEAWSKAKHHRIDHHALLEDHNDLPLGHKYGGDNDDYHTLKMTCPCMGAEDGIPQEVLDAPESTKIIPVTNPDTGETIQYVKYLRSDNSSWHMSAPTGNLISWGYNYGTHSIHWSVEDRDVVF